MKTPLHILIKQYRVIYIIVTLFFIWLAWDAWEWFKEDQHNMKEWAVAGFVSIYLAVIGVLKFVLENIRQDSEHDNE